MDSVFALPVLALGQVLWVFRLIDSQLIKKRKKEKSNLLVSCRSNEPTHILSAAPTLEITSPFSDSLMHVPKRKVIYLNILYEYLSIP